MLDRGNASKVVLAFSFRTILYHHYLEKIVSLGMQNEDHENEKPSQTAEYPLDSLKSNRFNFNLMERE